MTSIPGKQSWLRLLNQYKGSFREDDTTLASETQRAVRKAPKYATRCVSVIDVWRILSAKVSHRDPSASIYVNDMLLSTETPANSKPATLLAEYLGQEVNNYHSKARVASALLAKQLFRRSNVTPTGVYCEERYQSREGTFAQVNYPIAFAITMVNEEHQFCAQDHRVWRFKFYMVFSHVLLELWRDDQVTIACSGSKMADGVRDFCNSHQPVSIVVDVGRFDPFRYWPLCQTVKNYLQTDAEPFEIEDVVNLLRLAQNWIPKQASTARQEAVQFSKTYFGARGKWLVLILMLNVSCNFQRSSYLHKNFEELMN